MTHDLSSSSAVVESSQVDLGAMRPEDLDLLAGKPEVGGDLGDRSHRTCLMSSSVVSSVRGDQGRTAGSCGAGRPSNPPIGLTGSEDPTLSSRQLLFTRGRWRLISRRSPKRCSPNAFRHSLTKRPRFEVHLERMHSERDSSVQTRIESLGRTAWRGRDLRPWGPAPPAPIMEGGRR